MQPKLEYIKNFGNPLSKGIPEVMHEVRSRVELLYMVLQTTT